MGEGPKRPRNRPTSSSNTHKKKTERLSAPYKFRRSGSSSLPPGVFCLRPERRQGRAHPPRGKVGKDNSPPPPYVVGPEVRPVRELKLPSAKAASVVSSGSGQRVAARNPCAPVGARFIKAVARQFGLRLLIRRNGQPAFLDHSYICY